MVSASLVDKFVDMSGKEHVYGVYSGYGVELYSFDKAPVVRVFRKKKRPTDREWLEAHGARSDNIRRQKKSFERRVLYNVFMREDFPVFLTLTFRDMVSLSRAVVLLKPFFRVLRKRFGSVEYIGVVEFQKRGVPHFHFLVWGLPVEYIASEIPLSTLRGFRGKKAERWNDFFSFVGEVSFLPTSRNIAEMWGHGFIDILPTNGSVALARYFVKYLGKVPLGVPCAHRVFYSRGIYKEQRFTGANLDNMLEVFSGGAVDNVELARSFSFDTMWLGRANYSLFIKPTP